LAICYLIGPCYTLSEKGKYKYDLPPGYEEYESTIEIDAYLDYHLDEVRFGSKSSETESEITINYANSPDLSIIMFDFYNYCFSWNRQKKLLISKIS
jgi:hypothetical protein